MNVEEIAMKITEEIADKSSRFHNSRKFKKLSNISNVDEDERGIICNQILINGIVLAVLMFETTAELYNDNTKEHYYRELALELRNRLRNWAIELGAKEEEANKYKDAINAFINDYRNGYKYYKDRFPKFKGTNVWIPIVAICGFDRITRGRSSKEDDAYFAIFRNHIGKIATSITRRARKFRFP